MSFRRNQNRKQVIIVFFFFYNNMLMCGKNLSCQASSSLMGNAIPEKLISPWKLLHSIKFSESQSEITSMVFRGTNTLITASKEGYVS